MTWKAVVAKMASNDNIDLCRGKIRTKRVRRGDLLSCRNVVMVFDYDNYLSCMVMIEGEVRVRMSCVYCCLIQKLCT